MFIFLQIGNCRKMTGSSISENRTLAAEENYPNVDVGSRKRNTSPGPAGS
jgi:hypothetical protein